MRDPKITFALSPDGQTLAVADFKELLATSDGVLKLYTFPEGKLQSSFRTFRGPEQMAYSPDGKMVALANGNLSFWDPTKGEEVNLAALTRIRGGIRNRLAFSADGRWIARISNSAGRPRSYGFVDLWDHKAQKLAAYWDDSYPNLAAVAFSPDSTILAVGILMRGDSVNGKVQLYKMPK